MDDLDKVETGGISKLKKMDDLDKKKRRRQIEVE